MFAYLILYFQFTYLNLNICRVYVHYYVILNYVWVSKSTNENIKIV